jgi:hypothetical protein
MKEVETEIRFKNPVTKFNEVYPYKLDLRLKFDKNHIAKVKLPVGGLELQTCLESEWKDRIELKVEDKELIV